MLNTLDTIKHSDISFFLLDASAKISKQDKIILESLKSMNKPHIIIVNKVDLLNKIQIKLWPNGLQSIEEAWNKLFDLDIKYKSIQLKPKKTIRILASNILPKETSRMQLKI